MGSGKRVLLIAADFPPSVGGTAAYAHALGEGLRRAGADVHVVTSVGDRDAAAMTGVRVTRSPSILNRRWLKTLPLFWFGLISYLRDRPHWVVLMKCTHEGLVGYFLKRVLGARCVVVAYGAELLERRGDRTTRAVFQSADRILVDSAYTAELIYELGLDRNKVHVFYPGFAPTPLLPRDAVRTARARYDLDGKLVLLTVARLVKHKGHDQVLRALPLLAKQHANLVYLIVGDGEERRSLRQQIAALGVAPMVRMLGSLPWVEIEQLYQVCDVFVMPSRQEGTDVEGLGMVYFEAGLMGKPVVGGRSGGVPEAVREGETGFLVNPTDPEDIARVLARLLSDAPLRKQMGDNGRRRVLEEFSHERSAQQLAAALVDGRGDRP